MRLRIESFYDKQVISWSKLLLSIIGLWPENHNDFRFFFYITYIISCSLLLIVNLMQNMHDMKKVMRYITFVFPSILIVLKNVMFRWKKDQLLPILAVIKGNVKEGLYQTYDEKYKVIWYNIASTLFTTSSVTSLFFVPALYYLAPIFACILSNEYGSGNCTLPYELPVRVNLVYEISGMRSYVLFCVILIPSSTFLTIGATAADSAMISLTFYLCGQLSILDHRMKNIDLKSSKCHYEMKVLVKRHMELIQLANILADTFSWLMFVQTVGIIFSLCIILYQLLMTAEGEKEIDEIIHFMMYSIAVVLLAFCYCFLGECLISESLALEWACYSINWYESSSEFVHLLMICIARSRKPLCLTAGKFYVFSLETFGTIIKASMAYLSVLKTIT
ncbi:ObirOr5-Q3 [Ooceraea biroi]|uniref:Odorant receptor n=1 Tax=Ooceraea biroi TaxID=2015173 RepID=A0A3L8DVJ1_OOCBI|nr:odorant receptor 82a isoform X2 [Ooceraea biroi]RLU24510.1 ObirOr5-Q3 [Ooceraea biroi]